MRLIMNPEQNLDDTIRIATVASQLNVGYTHLVATLNDYGFKIEEKPTAKISQEMADFLGMIYKQDMDDKRKVNGISQHPTRTVLIRNVNFVDIKDNLEQQLEEAKTKVIPQLKGKFISQPLCEEILLTRNLRSVFFGYSPVLHYRRKSIWKLLDSTARTGRLVLSKDKKVSYVVCSSFILETVQVPHEFLRNGSKGWIERVLLLREFILLEFVKMAKGHARVESALQLLREIGFESYSKGRSEAEKKRLFRAMKRKNVSPALLGKTFEYLNLLEYDFQKKKEEGLAKHTAAKKKLMRKKNAIHLPRIFRGYFPRLILTDLIETRKALEIVSSKRSFTNYKTNEIVTIDLNKKGISEAHFFSYLINILGSEKLSFHTKQIDSFIPDIIYEDVDKGIYLVIEIDEPYDIESKTPIHCSDKNHDLYSMEHYLARGWNIIRFTERQVVDSTNKVACVKFIKEVIDYLAGERDDISNKFNSVNSIKYDKRWNEKKAIAMIGSDYRKKYLEKAGFQLQEIALPANIALKS